MSLRDIPQLFTSQIQDTYARENFRKITDFFRLIVLFSNFKQFETTFDAAQAHVKFQHNLGFTPKDILLTSKTGAGTVQFNQELSDDTQIDLTVTGACTVRFIAGAFN